MVGRGKKDTFKQIAFNRYLDLVGAEFRRAEPDHGNVGVIVARGVIMDGKQPAGRIGGESMADLIRRARQNPEIDALVLRVNSGDGSTEDGFVLGERMMQGGQGFDASIENEAGYWTVIMKRRLKSDQQGDLSIELGKVYNFGFAIHDDYSSARYHHVSLGYKLALDNGEAEVNVTAQ